MIITRIAPDVGWLPISFVNVYFIGRPGGPWTLIDSGLPGRANQIVRAAEARFGAGARPEAIVLTHGHFDHSGSALTLAKHWGVPIYAHKLEMPYLSGESDYPPPDPTVGGAMAFLSRFLPSRARDLRPWLRELTPSTVPAAAGWQWIATPGHSPGHVSLFRSSDRVLLPGDAFATVDMDSWIGLISGKRALARAGSPFNVDWEATYASLRDLVKLRPNVVGCGHGTPRSEPDLPNRLELFLQRFRAPRHGRYVSQPARTGERGIVALPPAPFDPVPYATAAGLILMGLALGAGYLDKRRK
ncbi:MAG: MBL fold metallo-hydrolase [Verrucomicrobiota bacterium]|nr:MBL fold metallo-hydrolase [Verrucomicrobiota bacterium]